ncbi:MAG: hypothetical protein EXQ56_09430 [Acidobacteria bacterium]|nr:hypothetical protein [Acidobacteriota bacterium]
MKTCQMFKALTGQLLRKWFPLALVVLLGVVVQRVHAETVVHFTASDGWKLTGTLYLPKVPTSARVPAAVLLSEPAWEDRTVYGTYLSGKLAENGYAVLTLDYRGTGASVGKKEFFDFTREERDAIMLDVRAALEFLSARPEVDSSRLALVAASWSADYAVKATEENPNVRALVLISGTANEASRAYLRSERSVPLLGVVGKDDKDSFYTAAENYALSPNPSSDILIEVGYGAGMFSHTKGLEERVVAWMNKNLPGLGSEREVSFKSSDGWQLRGRVRIPQGASDTAKASGVVMVHGARHDLQTYQHLAEELAKQGIASLRFDWRGKGTSIAEGKPSYSIDMSEEEEKKIFLDVKAAIDALASETSVDARRIGLIGATAGTDHALRAASGDDRIQTMVLLTSAAAPEGEAQDLLVKAGRPILAVASTEDINYNRGSLAEETRKTYLLSTSRESELILYEDAGRGSEMFKSKPELQRMVLRWFVDKLKPGATAGGKAGDAVAASR